VLDAARPGLLVFVDDDEYPVEDWLTQLVKAQQQYGCAMVAGPIIPVFDDSTSKWIKSIDLHNIKGLTTGDGLDYAAAGNFMMDTKSAPDIRFAEAYGKSGGEDTDFFLRLKDRGLEMRWCSEAKVLEDIPPAKAKARYMISRFMTQGANYRTIMNERGDISSPVWFSLRAFLIFAVSILVALVLIPVKHQDAGKWMKRAFANLGKLVHPQRLFYE